MCPLYQMQTDSVNYQSLYSVKGRCNLGSNEFEYLSLSIVQFDVIESFISNSLLHCYIQRQCYKGLLTHEGSYVCPCFTFLYTSPKLLRLHSLLFMISNVYIAMRFNWKSLRITICSLDFALKFHFQPTFIVRQRFYKLSSPLKAKVGRMHNSLLLI